jgi:hypothetical protein
METITVSIDLDNILRDCIDGCARYKRNITVPNEVLKKIDSDIELSKDEDELLFNYIISDSLKTFLDSKETLIIPDDATHKLAARIVKGMDDIGIEFVYQDFYAYQFVDKLRDIVRRAFRIREVFAKKNVPESVKTTCREAYHTFIHGYHVASIALCRSIVEAVLKGLLNVDIGELQKLNDTAFDRGLYSRGTWDRIDKVRRHANKCLHDVAKDKPPSEYDNLKILGFTQEVLQTLMSK